MFFCGQFVLLAFDGTVIAFFSIEFNFFLKGNSQRFFYILPHLLKLLNFFQIFVPLPKLFQYFKFSLYALLSAKKNT